jgi:hypothetical protein
MKMLPSVALACLYASSVMASPASFDYTKRAKHQAHIISRSLQTDPAAFASTSFTHLIIGGGTAGLAVAVRLSEVPSNIVGVIEAGPDGQGDPINSTPGFFGANLGSKYDWNYT